MGLLIKLVCSCSSRLLIVIFLFINNFDIGNLVLIFMFVIILLKVVIIYIMKNEKKFYYLFDRICSIIMYMEEGLFYLVIC